MYNRICFCSFTACGHSVAVTFWEKKDKSKKMKEEE